MSFRNAYRRRLLGTSSVIAARAYRFQFFFAAREAAHFAKTTAGRTRH